MGKQLGLRMRRAARVDSTQRAIVQALRAGGATVQPLHQLGGGIPDLLVALPTGETLLVECKAPRGKLTPDQVRWLAAWQGRVEVLRDPAEVAAVIVTPAATMPGSQRHTRLPLDPLLCKPLGHSRAAVEIQQGYSGGAMLAMLAA